MDFKEITKRNQVVAFIIFAITIVTTTAGITWRIIKEIQVVPLQERLKAQKDIAEQKQSIIDEKNNFISNLQEQLQALSIANKELQEQLNNLRVEANSLRNELKSSVDLPPTWVKSGSAVYALAGQALIKVFRRCLSRKMGDLTPLNIDIDQEQQTQCEVSFHIEIEGAPQQKVELSATQLHRFSYEGKNYILYFLEERWLEESNVLDVLSSEFRTWEAEISIVRIK